MNITKLTNISMQRAKYEFRIDFSTKFDLHFYAEKTITVVPLYSHQNIVKTKPREKE
jgi:hypothetical protein